MNVRATTDDAEEAAVLAAVRAGDASAFAALAERYRRQLQVHCYRMLGSMDDAEDLVQETLLRAWRSRAGFEGRSLFRTWLYRIATNACLNALERAPRRVMPQQVASPVTADTDPSEAREEPPWAPEIPWLQPYPDYLLEPAASPESDPEVWAVSRETIELAFLAALQHLAPQPRAILILRDVLDWSAKETADLLELTVPAVNNRLARARSTIRAQLPPDRADRPPIGPTSEAERALLQRFVDAWERADAAGITALLREDAHWAMPPAPLWFEGRAAIEMLLRLYPPDRLGDVRMIPTSANRQPAAAGYLRPRGEAAYRLTGLTVLRIEGDQIAELTTFSPALISAFGLPPTL
jgi:RNA polymerase sigma-70 factor (ECF subfamily)